MVKPSGLLRYWNRGALDSSLSDKLENSVGWVVVHPSGARLLTEAVRWGWFCS